MMNTNSDFRESNENLYEKKLQRLRESLTERKKKIYDLALEGCSTREIAERMFISIETVKTHRKDIVHEAEARDFNEIRIWALRSRNSLMK